LAEVKYGKLYALNAKDVHPEKTIPFASESQCYPNIKYYRYKLHTVRKYMSMLNLTSFVQEHWHWVGDYERKSGLRILKRYISIFSKCYHDYG
jgi:hypothetical protein